MIVRAAPPEHYGWIAKRAGLVIGPSFKALEALDDRGEIAGMVGFDAWTENAVSMHQAIANPAAVFALRRPAFGLAFDAPPRGAGKGVVYGTVLSTNEKAMRLDLALGFREVARLRDAWAVGVDIVFLEMRREDCRWLRGERRRAA